MGRNATLKSQLDEPSILVIKIEDLIRISESKERIAVAKVKALNQRKENVVGICVFRAQEYLDCKSLWLRTMKMTA